MKILVLNCGSSSISKWLILKEVIAQGGIEKIGLKDLFLKFTLPSGEKKVLMKDIPNIPWAWNSSRFNRCGIRGHQVIDEITWSHGGETTILWIDTWKFWYGL